MMTAAAMERKRFFEDLKDSGQRIVGSFGAGGERANEASLAFKKIIWPHVSFFDADFTSSGGGISIMCCDVGNSPYEVEEQFHRARLRDIIDVYLTRDIVYRNARRWRSFGLGINSGTKLRGMFYKFIAERHMSVPFRAFDTEQDFFGDIPTSPTLHILATPYSFDHRGSAFIFCREHTPRVSISRALMASCADVIHFSWQRIASSPDGQTGFFGDAARVEPLPLVSVLRQHVAAGYDPSRLTILAVIPTYDLKPPPVDASALRHLVHAAKDNVRTLITNQIRYIAARGARVMLLEPNVDFIDIAPPKPKYLAERVYKELNIEHFHLYYPHFVRMIEALFGAAIRDYFAHKDKRTILAYIDKFGTPRVKAHDEL